MTRFVGGGCLSTPQVFIDWFSQKYITDHPSGFTTNRVMGMTGQKHLAILINNSQKCATELTGKTRAFAHGLWPQRKCCRLIKTRVYTTKMSNFKYGASCTEVMYKKLEHPTDNLKDTRLFICRQAKNRQAKNKILFHACGSRRGSRLAAQRCITCKSSKPPVPSVCIPNVYATVYRKLIKEVP